jgi:hypothetical protein
MAKAGSSPFALLRVRMTRLWEKRALSEELEREDE